MRVRVLTMNVQNDDGGARRVAVINEEIRRSEPDLVALQEVLPPPSRAAAAALLAETSLTVTHQADVLNFAMPFEERYGGTAVATRWPHRFVELLDQRGEGALDVPWCTLAVVVDIPDLGELLFIATTMSWRLEAEATRERQALAVTDLDARHRRALPSIIAGDFNADPDAASIRYLRGLQSLQGRSVLYHDAWSIAHPGQAGFTWDARNPRAAEEMHAIVRQPGHRRRLDYVFTGSWHAHPKARAEVVEARLVLDQPVDGVWASDHFGLLVDLDITGGPD
jgi:endonuclease/exonuclease/phosphatase family metal-dependent hydrolase